MDYNYVGDHSVTTVCLSALRHNYVPVCVCANTEQE